MEKKSFYLTTTIPYVNAEPHIGFALEIVQADVIARLHRLQGNPTFFSTGSDEHGQKIWQKAKESGQEVQVYVDYYAAKFNELKVALDLSNDNFIRTTAPHHIAAAQEFWRRCAAKGDIYKKKYAGLYCVGCERFVTEKDLVNGLCPDHNKAPVEIEEENYFFKLSRYQDEILAYLRKPGSIVPESRREEAVRFVEGGLEDFSISRVKDKMPWGVPVPDDESQVMYVWFDAFVNYISTLGWPADAEGNYKKFWVEGDHMQFAGKDQIRFQSIMWQGMLMSAGLPTTDRVVYHGFVTSGGQKMSKTIGNVISPFDLVREYGTDAVRYFLLREVTPFEDSDITLERFKEAYNANLVNGLGNLVSRIMKMSETYLSDVNSKQQTVNSDEQFAVYSLPFASLLAQYEFAKAMDMIWGEIALLDQKIQTEKPFSVWKTDQEKARTIVRELVQSLGGLASQLEPFLPATAEAIKKAIEENKMPAPLFPRKD